MKTSEYNAMKDILIDLMKDLNETRKQKEKYQKLMEREMYNNREKAVKYKIAISKLEIYEESVEREIEFMKKIIRENENNFRRIYI